MAQTAYWVIAPTSGWSTPAAADIRLGTVSGGVVYGSETAPGSGSGTITEATLVTALSAGTGYTVAWTVYDDVALTYSNVEPGTFTTLNPVSVSVPAAALTLTAYAAAVTASAHQTVSVPAGALTLTGYAPTATASEHQTVSVPAASLTLTGYAPAVNISGSQTVSPPLRTLTFAASRPMSRPATISRSRSLSSALTLTGYAPSVEVNANQTVQVPASALTLTGYAPTATTTGHQFISVPAAALYLSPHDPTVSNGEEAPDGGFIEIDYEPKLWWKHKPKALAQEEARKKIEVVGKIISAKAAQHVDQAKPKPQRVGEVRQAVKAAVSDMPAFDWRPFYDHAYQNALDALIRQAAIDADAKTVRPAVAQEIDRIRRLRDDEDVAILARFI